MKTNKLKTKLFLTLLGLASLASVDAQYWTASGGNLYSYPITTKVGIGISAPTFGLHLLNTTFGVENGVTKVKSDGTYLSVNKFQGMAYSDMQTYITPAKIQQYDAGYYQATATYSPSQIQLRSSAPVPVYNESIINQGTVQLTTSVPSLTLRGIYWDGVSVVANHGFTFVMNNYSKLQLTNSETTSKVYFTINESNGYMGIGTVNPSTMLSVNGKITAEEIEVKDVAADFVFDKNYSLRSLKDVEKYISENKHLPDVAAAEETCNGVNLGAFNQTLLQKVEELTLYMIQLQKQNEALQVKVDALQK
jgi:hypothetical protein